MYEKNYFSESNLSGRYQTLPWVPKVPFFIKMGRNDTFVLYLYLKYKKGKWSELNYFEHIVQFLKGSCDVNIVTVDYSDFLM